MKTPRKKALYPETARRKVQTFAERVSERSEGLCLTARNVNPLNILSLAKHPTITANDDYALESEVRLQPFV